MSSGVSREALSPALMAEVLNAEKLLKRRLPIGSQISERLVVEDFVKQVCPSLPPSKTHLSPSIPSVPIYPVCPIYPTSFHMSHLSHLSHLTQS